MTEESDDGEIPQLAEQRDVETVYQPAEDSKLLADAVVETIDPGLRVLDVGTGSGYLATRLRNETDADAVGVDLNPEACQQAFEAGVPVVRGDMFEAFRDEAFDVVVCNPPYLPTPPEQEWDDWMERALSGGEDGRAMVDPFLDGVGRVLADGGTAYLLLSTLTGPDEVRAYARERGLDSEIIAEESHPFEKLLVVRFRPGP
ncbi:methyltransferase domain-containing protein [Halovenus sp. WSH3]|uniref:Methyltransferase domain-containing protein n=1 Tax=Halovenus carboxidivorans TaxID=2692199 RepID=A0A6B0T7G7_9EURY|nr:HemK2/MTQ2 family protein methyltransferase [Halovenus carboxidivorans]MXR51533.1 methyltransferase domain-containing protein [Halovenus carboxidivorans]